MPEWRNASHSPAIGSAQLAFCSHGTIRIACDFREGVLSRARRLSPWSGAFIKRHYQAIICIRGEAIAISASASFRTFATRYARE